MSTALGTTVAQGPPRARLGRAVKAIRTHLSLKLTDVSAMTGISVATLSKVEHGQLSLTYDKLVQLSEGLGVDIAALVSGEPVSAPLPGPPTARRSITRRQEGLLVETPHYDYRYLCTDLAHKAMVPILITIRARSTLEGRLLSHHAGEEFIHVLRGPIEVHTEFYAPVTLRAGESIYIDSRMRHGSVSTGKRDAKVLNICYSPGAGHFRTLVELAATQGEAPVAAGAGPVEGEGIE